MVARGQGVLIIYIEGSDHVCYLKVEVIQYFHDSLWFNYHGFFNITPFFHSSDHLRIGDTLD